jgi:hypothetical protein
VLGTCTSLESLDVRMNLIESPLAGLTLPFTDALPRCGRLRRLDLSVNKLGVHLFTELVRVLPRCSALEYLSLFDCNVEESWVRILPPVLTQCAALRELDLRENEAWRPHVHAALRTAWEAVGREPARLLLDAPV